MVKGAGKLIVSLLIIAIGIKLIAFLGQPYIKQVPGVPADLTNSLESVSNLLIIGIGIIILILLPFYLSEHSEKKP